MRAVRLAVNFSTRFSRLENKIEFDVEGEFQEVEATAPRSSKIRLAGLAARSMGYCLTRACRKASP